MPGPLRRGVFLTHRWLGVALALLMAMWAASGVVMMYVAYPETTAAERLAGLEPLDLRGCCASVPPLEGVESAAVEMLDGRPVLRAGTASGPTLLDLRTGKPLVVDRAAAAHVARTYLARSTGAAPRLSVRRTEPDQWTVSGEFGDDAPLYKVGAADRAGTVLYVSGVTGEVVQDTTRSERMWNWFGAIPHWLYFARLRENGTLWSGIVVYASLLGTFLTAIGLYIGVTQLGRGRRAIPYRGLAWWHHLTGLVFGVLTLTWVASGLLSMNPWGWMESQGPGEELAALSGRPAEAKDVVTLVRSLAAGPTTGAVRVELAIQGGTPYAVVIEPSGLRWRASLPYLETAPPTQAELDALAPRARPDPVVSAEPLPTGDAYHYSPDGAALPPVWRVIYGDAQRTRLYFDPRTGELVDYVDAPARAFRWWHSALHRFDFAAALRRRPLWDVVVLPLMLGVTVLCLIGLALAARRLLRTVKSVGTRPV